MADKEAGLANEAAAEAQTDSDDSSENLETALERRDREITQLNDALLTEQRLANNLRSKLKKLDAKIGDSENGLDTTRDLQAVLAEQKTIEDDAANDLEERDLAALQTRSEERAALLREFQGNLNELTCQRDRLAVRLAEIDRLANGSDRLACDRSRRPGLRPELNSLEELMAETVVLTDEARDKIAFELDDTAVQKQAVGEVVDMVSPEAMLPLTELAEPANDGRHGTLIVTFQGGHTLRYPVFDRDITIGRSAKSDIQINSEFVSRNHARIAIGSAGPVIEDVSSMNGMVVNADIVKRHIFRTGDVVVLGTTRLTFQKNTSIGRD